MNTKAQTLRYSINKLILDFKEIINLRSQCLLLYNKYYFSLSYILINNIACKEIQLLVLCKLVSKFKYLAFEQTKTKDAHLFNLILIVCFSV